MHDRKRQVILALLGLGLSSVPSAAAACGGRGGNGSGGSGGGGAGNATGSGTSGTAQGASGGPAWGGGGSASPGSTAAGGGLAPLGAGLAGVARLASDFLEVQTGFAWQSLNGGTMPWRGWDGHPLLGEQFGYSRDAQGARLGLSRLTLMGATTRVNALVGGFLTLGGAFTYLTQINGNESVPGSRGTFLARGAQGIEGGGEIGLIAVVGPVNLRASVFGGARHLWATVDGLGFAGCDSVPVATSTQPVVVPRLQIERQVSTFMSIGASVGMDLLHPGDVSGAVTFSFHGSGWSTFADSSRPATGDPASAAAVGASR